MKALSGLDSLLMLRVLLFSGLWHPVKWWNPCCFLHAVEDHILTSPALVSCSSCSYDSKSLLLHLSFLYTFESMSVSNSTSVSSSCFCNFCFRSMVKETCLNISQPMGPSSLGVRHWPPMLRVVISIPVRFSEGFFSCQKSSLHLWQGMSFVT